METPEDIEKKKKKKRAVNDIAFVKSIKHFENLQLDPDSPMLQQACKNLGIKMKELSKKKIHHF